MEIQNNESISKENKEEGLLSVQNRIESFIDNLSGLNELDKYWARKDALEILEKSEDLFEAVKKLEKKYSFYDKAGSLRNEICKKAPDGNGNSVCNLIDSSILSVSSEGGDRSWKLDELKTINKSIDSWKKETDVTQFIRRHQELSDTVVAKILMLFDSKFAEQFKQFQEEMGAPQFWTFTRAMSPADFPNFTTTFNFRVQRDFLKDITRKNLSEWPKKLKKALTRDAEEILDSKVFDKTRDQELSRLKSAKTVADLVSRLLELKIICDTEEFKLKKEKQIQKRQEKIDTKKKEELKKKNEKKKEEEDTYKKEKKETLQQKIEDKDKKEKEQKKKEEENVDLGGEKQIILEFYDRVITHTEKVILECPEWGVDPNDIKHWGQEGVKNRSHLLKQDGGEKWKHYVKFNSNDKYLPSKVNGDGFRHRWLNVKTGSRISAASATASLKYMRRYKESGCQLFALAGAFSIDWAGSDSPVYTPVRFLEKMHSLRNELIGKSSKK